MLQTKKKVAFTPTAKKRVKIVGVRKTHPSHLWLQGELLAKNGYHSFLHFLPSMNIFLKFDRFFSKKSLCNKQGFVRNKKGLVRNNYTSFSLLKQYFRSIKHNRHADYQKLRKLFRTQLFSLHQFFLTGFLFREAQGYKFILDLVFFGPKF